MQVVSLDYPNNNPNIGQYISHLKLDIKAECLDCEPVNDGGLMVYTFQLHKNGGHQKESCEHQPVCGPGYHLSGGANPRTSVLQQCEACGAGSLTYTDTPRHQDPSCTFHPACGQGQKLSGQSTSKREKCIDCGDFEYMLETDHRKLACEKHPTCEEGVYVCGGAAYKTCVHVYIRSCCICVCIHIA